MLHVWELGIETRDFLDGHDLYSGPLRSSVFEFEPKKIVFHSNLFDVFLTGKPKRFMNIVNFSKSGFPGRCDYGHAVNLESNSLVYSRVQLTPLAEDSYLLLCRKPQE